MNEVHQYLVNHIRKMVNDADSMPSKVARFLCSMTDEELVRLMFTNFRGRGKTAKGLRLSGQGLGIMQTFFKSITVEAPEEGRKMTGDALLYLDKKATLPYHVDMCGEIVCFDSKLGLKLKLVDGDIAALIEAEGR